MTQVRNFSSTDPNAPVLSGTAGSLIALLDALLVTGYGLAAPTGITVAAGVATVNYSSGHSFVAGSVALIAGATPAALNGEKRVLTVGTNTITFAAPGVPDGPATGTLTSRVAPAGWEKAFTGTNVAVYRSLAPESTKLFIRVDDSGTTTARVVGYETMSDLNTGTAAFPLAGQLAGGVWGGKSDQANATARPWRIVATDRTVYMWASPSVASGNQVTGFTQAFGDTRSYRSGDAFACFVSGARAGSSVLVSTANVTSCLGYPRDEGGASVFRARSPLSLGGSVEVFKFAANNSVSGYSGSQNYSTRVIPFPNPADNSLLIAPLELQNNSFGLMGQFPGVYHCAQNLAGVFNTGDPVAGEGVYAGKRLMALRVGSTNVSGGVFFIDTSDPWEY